MNLVNYLQFMEPLQENLVKIYSTASDVITILLVLWCLNFIGGLIQRTYATGQAFGRFYRTYLHRYAKGSIIGVLTFFTRGKKGMTSSSVPSYRTDPNLN